MKTFFSKPIDSESKSFNKTVIQEKHLLTELVFMQTSEALCLMLDLIDQIKNRHNTLHKSKSIDYTNFSKTKFNINVLKSKESQFFV